MCPRCGYRGCPGCDHRRMRTSMQKIVLNGLIVRPSSIISPGECSKTMLTHRGVDPHTDRHSVRTPNRHCSGQCSNFIEIPSRDDCQSQILIDSCREMAGRTISSLASTRVRLAYELHRASKHDATTRLANNTPVLFLHGFLGSKRENRQMSR